MMKRTLSFLLALIMTVGLMPATVVRAAENQDVVYVDENTSMSDLVDQGIVQMEQSVSEPIMSETPTNGGMDSKQESEPVTQIPEPVTQMPEPTPEAPKLSVCDCGMEDADIYYHSDTCALRLYYYRICDGTAAQIYDLWRNVGLVTRGFLEDYLTANYPEKLEQVHQLIEAEAEPDSDTDVDHDDAERLPGEASATVDGITVDALGVPEGSSLTVKEPADDVVQIIEEIVAEAEEEPEQVFFYDISVQNDESSDWQPENTSVKMSISVPGLKLHKYAEVNILHVDDEGNTSALRGTLDESGNIVFETDGFSSFAGFTVDFAYGTALVSIPGKTSTTMGALFEEMKMPLYASDIVDVQFTDYSLLTVTREEDDWRLTSLKAFSTNEILTFTMADGTVYEFVVTDATTPTIQTGSNGAVIKDTNDYTRWFAKAGGLLTEGNDVGKWQSAYWAKDKIVYVNGAGSFGFGIAPDPNLDKDSGNCFVYMKQIRISGGTKVKVSVHSHFLNPGTEYENRTPWSKIKDVILCSYAIDSSTAKESLFLVENGSLELVCDYPSIDFCLRGSYHYKENGVEKKIYNTQPLVTLGAGATSFTAKNITFYNGHNGGIYSKATNVSSINLTDCIFENTVYREGGNGGAIYLSGQQGSTSAGYRTIGELNLTRCEFQSNRAGGHGGAIYIGDTVGRIRITDCKFTGCKADRSGGAIAFRGNFGKVSITGSDSAGTDDSKKTIFQNCEAAANGGAINMETVQQNVDGTWVKDQDTYTHYSRTHTLNLSGVKFTSCKARGDYTYVDDDGITKGSSDGAGGAINLNVQLQNLNLNHCEFDGCESGGQYVNLGGAGICFGYSNVGDTPISDTNNQYQIYGGNPTLKGWNTPATWTEKDDAGKTVTRGTEDARSLTLGFEHEDKGVKYTRQRSTFGDVRIENTTFKNGKSFQGGGFLIRTGASIENLNVITVRIDNCEASFSGSAVIFQNCTVGAANFTDCTFSNCRVTKAINEGGGTFRSVGQTGTVLNLTRCHFLGNAGNIAGGGLYWNAAANKISVGQYAAGKREPNETMVTLTNCDFQRNTALVDESVKDYKEVTDEKGEVIHDIITGAAQMEVLTDSAGNESRYRRVGGGIFCEAKMVITGCTFTGNRSLLGGGLCMGVYNSDYRKFEPNETTELELDTETVFSYNVAENGGGLAIRANATKAIDNDKDIKHTIEFILGGAEVHHNYATENGGGIYYIAESYVADPNNPDYDPDLDNAEVRRLIKKVTIDNGTIYSNRAVLNGGGIYVESDYNTTVSVSNGTIYNNKAGAKCGSGDAIGMTATNTGTKDENGNDIYTYALEQEYLSTPGGNGGGIYVNGADALVNITGGVIGAYWLNDTLINHGNWAYGRSGNLNSGYGGGIAVYGGANVTMSDGDVVYNVAYRNGGGIAANDGAEVTMSGGNIQYNKADRRDYADGHGKYSGVGGGIALANSSMIYSNGTISDNTAYNGGGIALSESTMKFTNGTIENNAAAVAGGGISVHNQSTMYISNGTISNNQAVVGGGISVNNSAGDDSSTDETKKYGMYLDGGNVTNNHVIPCAFTNADTGTSAYGGGICVAANSDMKINGGTITGNTAASDVEATTYAIGQEGGGIAVCQSATMEISGGSVKENKAYNGGGIVIRGGSTVTMSGTLAESKGKIDLEKSTGIIVSNHAEQQGGGVCLTGADSTFTMSNGCINNNSCTTETTSFMHCKGGGVFVDTGTSFTLTGGHIDGNNAADGGGIYVDHGSVTINGGYLIGNEVHRHGGAIYSDYSTVTVNGGEFASNKAHGTTGYHTPGAGGAIFSYGTASAPSVVSITGGNFHDNYAMKNGGAVSVEGKGSFTVSDGTFKNNTSPGAGGAFYAGTVTCTISGGTFTANSSTGDSGGGATFNGTNTTISNGTFTSNTAAKSGGAINVLNGTFELTGGTFTANTAVTSAGGLYVEGSTVTIGGGTFTENSTEGNGGAAYLYNATTTISNGTFTSNTATSNAGALAVRNGTFELTGGTFTSNTATKSGGAAYFNGSTVTISGGTFTGNSSTEGSGGGAYFNNGTIDISGGTFIENSTKENGGAAYFNKADTTISNGTFTSNKATGNAGAVSVRDGTFELTGGTFTSNTADKAGGGLYVNGGTITLGGGQFTGNVSKSYGGGANLSGADVTFTDGTFDGNVAQNGGGLSIVQSSVEFDGGTFENNIADRGGAVYIRSATVTIDEITVNNNHATADSRYGESKYKRGGGICVDTAGTGPANVIINGGTITGNTAQYGGGLWIRNNATITDKDTDGPVGNTATLTMNGGTVSGNTASSRGGGIWIGGGNYISDTERTSLTMNGGIISNNKTSGHGGGIWAGELAQVSILATDTTQGEITNNTARNGGGVFVTTGADLTVTNGYITYNKANQGKTTSPSSPYQVNDGLLYGVGGGICVINGTSNDPSSFTLNKVEGNNKMAIYGNTATFAADDVFANGSNTQLNVPQVADMDLVGYGFKPEGWFEDYNTQDSSYKYGLDMVTTNGGTITELADGQMDGVLRYRNANAVQRRYMHITPEYVSDTGVNKANAYVAMTLGIPAAADDTVVIDFGSMVSIDVWKNDLFMNETDFANTKNSQDKDVHHSYIGPQMPNTQIKDGVRYSTKKPTTTTAKGFYQNNFRGTTNGQVYNRKNGIMTFEPEKMVMDHEVTFFYMVEHNTVWYYANVTVVPATSIYFEDNENELDNVNKTLITYHKTSTVENLAQWQTVGTAAEEKQDQDRPGVSILEGLDADNIYGYDGNYSTTASYSNGSAHWVTVTRDRETRQTTAARASFTFTGTGFDVVSLCKANTGIVMVSVYKGEVVDFDKPPFEDRYITSYIVDTHYGYVYNIEMGKWEVNEKSDAVLYQVPVIKVDLTKVRAYEPDDPTTEKDESRYYYKDYGYGTYTAEIYVSNSFLEREPGYWSAEFYLDAIRIYNPAGYDGIYSYEYDAVKRDEDGNPMYDDKGNPLYEKVTKTSSTDTIKNAYQDDHEAWPAYTELRNMFINQVGSGKAKGVIFIDGQEKPSFEAYQSWGPNNEVYLNPGQSVAFTLDATDYAQNVASVQVGLRGLTAMGNVRVRCKAPNEDYYTDILKTKISSTDLYYDISWKDAEGKLGVANKVIAITNPGTIKVDGKTVENTVPIAITNIKVTHSGVPTKPVTTYFMVNDDTKSAAIEMLTADSLADPVVTPKYPALSFDGMVRYHVFFHAEDLGQITPANLGLAVFDSYDPEGTVETAKDVIMGATGSEGQYMIPTNGVHAKYLGDQQYFRVFAKKADGSYVYSKMVSYSAVDYAKNALANSADPALRRLAVAMLNYGAEAQKFFGYKTDELINKDLTADDQALVNGFHADALNRIQKVDVSKVGCFASTGGFTRKAPAISFNGAFEINYFFTPAYAVDGDLELYFWNEDTYNSVTELTAENADKAVAMELKDGVYTASSDEIAAKYLDKTLYVAAVYESNGVIYCSGVLPYSIAAYCQNPPADVQALAAAAAIYGCTAKQYFGV